MADQTKHINDLIEANRERLHVLEIQAARFGNETPPHILTEINKIVATLRALTTVEELTPEIDETQPQEILTRDKIERRRDASTNEAATHRMIATVQATVAEVSNVKVTLREEIKDIHDQLDEIRSFISSEVSSIRTTIEHIVINGVWVLVAFVLISVAIAVAVYIFRRYI